MNKYERERAEEKRAFLSLLRDIASHLDGWDVDEKKQTNIHSGVLSGRNGMGIHVSKDNYREKLRISGCWPRTIKGDTYYPRDKKLNIGVSSQRDPEAIARDIERRFLPTYLLEYERQCELVRQEETTIERICMDVTEISDLLGQEVSNGLSDDPRSLRIHYNVGEARVTFQHRYNREFEIKITNVGLDLTLKIAQLLREEKESKDDDREAIESG